jgi:hypothetical protein
VVIDVAGVDLGPVRQQVIRDLDGLREVQRPLAITTLLVDDIRVRLDDLLQLVEPSETCRRVRGEDCAARDQVSRDIFRGRIQHAERTCLPIAAQVDVGAEVDEHIQHIAMLRRHLDRPRTERAERVVDLLPHRRRDLEDLSQRDSVAAMKRRCRRLQLGLFKLLH